MRVTLLLSLPLLGALACRTNDKANGGDPDLDTADLSSVDADGDGFTADEDCDDDDASVNGGATELCDGVDNDCDGEVDEGVTGTWYTDADGDGYGDAASPVEACSQPAGAVSSASDCDDTDATINPVASERCNGVDDDCDGEVDEELVETWHADTDGDGFGDPGAPLEDCDPPSGYVDESSDCDDANAAVNPDADEVCDGLDNDCDGDIDTDATDASTWYLDADGDGFGDADTAVEACEAPGGYVADSTDCDDAAFLVHPDATEVCNSLDDDCDGLIDDADSSLDASSASTWYDDLDGDGYGDASSAVLACSQPAGTVADDSDCLDSDAAVHPAASEICDGQDNDCDGLTDNADPSLDASSQSTYYADADGDGYGDASSAVLACAQPSGTVTDATDCDDAAASVNPGESEVCNGVDDDCDGLTDNADASLDASTQSTYYADSDGDGYGDASSAVLACAQPSGTVTDATDCDDAAASVNPGESEVCNGVDDDCDGLTDDADASLDASTQSTYYADSDGDGYGDAGTSTDACSTPSGYVADDTDCDDAEAAVNPGALDICNGDDDNCDGDIDEEALVGMALISVDTNDGVVYEIDPSASTATAITTLSVSGSINSVAVDGADAIGHDYANERLVELDVCNGTEVALPGHGTGANTCGIVFGPGGLLYGLDTTNERLVEYDPATGGMTVIGSLGISIGSCGLAYDCTNDVLIGADGSSDTVFKINATTGAAYDQVSVGFDFRSVGIEFDPERQSLLASTRSDLYEVDIATGSSTSLGSMAATNIDDLIYYPECP